MILSDGFIVSVSQLQHSKWWRH